MRPNQYAFIASWGKNSKKKKSGVKEKYTKVTNESSFKSQAKPRNKIESTESYTHVFLNKPMYIWATLNQIEVRQ